MVNVTKTFRWKLIFANFPEEKSHRRHKIRLKKDFEREVGCRQLITIPHDCCVIYPNTSFSFNPLSKGEKFGFMDLHI